MPLFTRRRSVLVSRRPARSLLSLAAAVVSLAASPAAAQRFDEKELPSTLKPWVSWALDGEKPWLCPAVGEEVVCAWPGRLALDLTTSGGRFRLQVAVDQPLFFPLPGDEKRWPLGVLVDGKPAVCLPREEKPAVYLAAGTHTLEGRFAWSSLPDSLAVPGETALLDLTVGGRAVASPRREEDGTLLLRSDESSDAEGENLNLQVFRMVRDGVPLFVTTRVKLEVSGRAREVRLAGSLLAGATPVSVTGDLPARLDRDGTLRVQVRGGSFDLAVLSRLAGRPEKLGPPKAAEPWPEEEIWVFSADERLRQTELGGAAPVDPSRTELPTEWRAFPAFLLKEGVTLTLKETRRGEPESAPDQLSLSRTLWLDESGASFTVEDAFSGTLGRTTRLDLRAPGTLGRVAVRGESQVITRGGGGLPGVELRRVAVAAKAESRLPRAGALPAVGWDVNVQSLRGTLRLPPGWRLLGATGVDQIPNSWLSRFTLFSFFFVLIVALAAGKLSGLRTGLLAAAALVLCHGEVGAPEAIWISLLAATALLGVVPAGLFRRLCQVWWVLSALVLAYLLVPFATREIRTGLYPQTASGAGRMRGDGFLGVDGAVPPPQVAVEGDREAPRDAAEQAPVQNVAPSAPPPAKAFGDVNVDEPVAVPGTASSFDRVGSSALPSYEGKLAALRAAGKAARQKAYVQDPNAVIQTGPGLPAWNWTPEYPLIWSGPVPKDHTMRFFLLPPWLNLFLAFLRVGLTALLGALLVVDGLRRFPSPRPEPIGGSDANDSGPVAATAAAALLLALTLGAGRLAADEPPTRQAAEGVPADAILSEMKERLTRRAPCHPDCVATASVALSVSNAEIRVEAEVHAGELAAWPVPGPAESWVPAAVTVDGAPSSALARLGDGFLHLRVPPGVHRVVVSGPPPRADGVTLQFPSRPGHATASASGWQVDGLKEGTIDGSVQLTRLLSGRGSSRTSEGAYEPWLEVTRRLSIGISWQAETTVRRVSPTGSPVVVKVPVLAGMLVTDADRPVEDGHVRVALGRDEVESTWSASLAPPESGSLALAAAEGKPWSEVWILECGPVWQCEAEGLPPVSRTAEGDLVLEYRPWPDETLTVKFRRPEALTGATLTVDQASLALFPGIRLLDASLDLSVRASRSGVVALSLPAGADVQSVKVDGRDKPVRPSAAASGKTSLDLTIEAGPHRVSVAWREAGGLGLLFRAPAVSLGRAAVNANVTIRLPAARWLLLTGGPRWGPAILVWGYLLVALGVAYLLGKLPSSPLATWQWLLLALGLSPLPAPASAVVAGWFLALAFRRRAELSSGRHNLVQVGLFLWTLAALGLLYAAVHAGLLLSPDMLVTGNGSSMGELRWYADRLADDGALPRPWVLSAPLLLYRLAMLAWALWLALSLVQWLRWAWESYSAGGVWKKAPPRPVAPPPVPPPPAPSVPPVPPVLEGGVT